MAAFTSLGLKYIYFLGPAFSHRLADFISLLGPKLQVAINYK
jgi:hypothetical protein